MQNMQQNWDSSYLFGGNGAFVEELYEIYLENPSSVDDKWKKYFDSLQDGKTQDVNHSDVREKFAIITSNPLAFVGSSEVMSATQTKVYGLIAAFRALGHKFAKLDPLERQEILRPAELDYRSYAIADSELEQEFYDDYDLRKAKTRKLKDIIKHYEAIYCAKSAFEIAHISNTEEQEWLRDYVESNYTSFTLQNNEKQQILQKLTEADGLERYLHTKYVGQKRFSLEGGDSLIPMLDRILTKLAHNKVNEMHIGMAHRGRLNTLINITGKAPQKLFDEFDGNYPHYDFVTSGDVKYHKGYGCEYVTINDDKIKVSMAFNPSHLEVVNPIVQGIIRARQDQLKQDEKHSVVGLLIHGDSALIGLGTNQAVFNMSLTRSYGGYGLIHIVVNNQVGFTTSRVSDNRSSRYSTDIAKMVESPIMHVNSDDLTAVMFACDLAVSYRQKYAKDFMIDLVCFRRHGHNEADDPTLTQPLMYAKVKQHPGIRKLYVEQLVKDGVIKDGEADILVEAYRDGLLKGEHINKNKMIPLPRYNFETKNYLSAKWQDKVSTAISAKKLDDLAEKITRKPTEENFGLHPTVAKLIDTRIAMGAGKQPIDFGMAETLAYAAILDDGISIRLSGEDASRGTFSHRHAAWHNMNRTELSKGIYIPLHNAENNSYCAVYDSILNEEGVLGFEYGYSLENVKNLTLWEAQFGDFANGAQVMIDQFIISGEAKWGSLSRLVLLLPHGFDGQGPEHSSARIERFLQLSAENNIILAYPSTAAQMFHLLRRQAKSNYVKPLVIFLSKRLLRFKDAMSSVDDITKGAFLPIITDMFAKNSAKRIVLCAGQVYYDLVKSRSEANKVDDIAIIRVEQLYPFPRELLTAELSKYSKATEFVWAQEEPYNQGAWLQIREDLDACLPSGKKAFTGVARPSAAAPACGTSTMHNQQLANLLVEAIGS